MLSIANEDEALIDGVTPTGFSAGGADVQHVSNAFRSRYLEVLWDLSSQSATFEEFKARVEELFSQTYEEALELWQEGVKRVRSTGEELKGFPKKSADEQPPEFRVVQLAIDADRDSKVRPQPTFNASPELRQAA